jgi:uncharacterized protein (TIGR03086 family)
VQIVGGHGQCPTACPAPGSNATLVIDSAFGEHPGVDELVERHARACADFARVAHSVGADAWSAPSPCTEWTARDVVEHVIGFHEFLLLRPLGVRAQRPRADPAARWDATANALFGALSADGAVDRATELPGGGTSTPGTMLDALTTEMLVHTWDLARAAGVEPVVDDELWERALMATRGSDPARGQGMIGAEVAVAARAPVVDRLVAFYGRDPAWAPSA